MRNTTHMIPTELTRRPARLHYTYATIAGQLLVTLVIGAIIGATLLLHHDAPVFPLHPTEGTYVRTADGVAEWIGGQWEFCPNGWTDTQCGA